jgi:uncharacterized protein (TIRG00374 family)
MSASLPIDLYADPIDHVLTWVALADRFIFLTLEPAAVYLCMGPGFLYVTSALDTCRTCPFLPFILTHSMLPVFPISWTLDLPALNSFRRLEGRLLTTAILFDLVSHEIELPSLHPGKSIALIALGMGLYFLYLYHIGFQEIIRSLGNVDLAIFSVGFVLAILGVLFDSLAWQVIVKKFDYSVPTRDIFLIYMSCIFMNNLIPSGSFSGETARIYFLEKLAGSSRIDKTSATVAATRIITAIPFIIGTIIGLAFLVFATDVPAWALITCTSIAAFLLLINVIFLGVCYMDGWLERIVFALVNLTERVFRVRVDRIKCQRMVGQFHESMMMLIGHKRTLFISTFWAVAGWFSMILVAFLTFRSMGVEVPVRAVFAVYAVMIFLQMLPLFLPGGLGLVDIVMITLFNAIGVPMHGAVAATILIRIIQLWFLTAIGGASMAYLIRKINHNAIGPAINKSLPKSF